MSADTSLMPIAGHVDPVPAGRAPAPDLDGKVNPEALARRQKDEVLDYVVESDIRYVVDWAGVGDWVTGVVGDSCGSPEPPSNPDCASR